MATPPRVIDIQVAVARHYDLPLTAFRTPNRRRPLVRARQMAMYLCRELTGRSYDQIGQHFGNRDHSTVIHAVRTIKRCCASDPEFSAARDQLRTCLQVDHGDPEPST